MTYYFNFIISSNTEMYASIEIPMCDNSKKEEYY